MTDTTQNLGLPWLFASQTDKHVTVNESLSKLDRLIMGATLSKRLTQPPQNLPEGSCWLLPQSVSGAWSGHAGKVATWIDGAWRFDVPNKGWMFWVTDQARHAIWTGAKWDNLSDIISTVALSNFTMGPGALAALTTGGDNLACGENALLLTTSGNHNTAVGKAAMLSNTNGSLNCAFGNFALQSNSTGTENVAAGYAALVSNSTGSKNSSMGLFALYSNTTGNQNTAAGNYALSSLGVYNNCSGLGFNSQVTGDNQVQLGDSRTTVYVHSPIQSRSDLRDKANVRDTVFGLAFLRLLRPVDFRWDLREDYTQLSNVTELPDLVLSDRFGHERTGAKKRKRFHSGLIAQEVEKAAQTLGYDFGGLQHHAIAGGEDVYTLSYESFIGPLIQAVQTLADRLDKLEANQKLDGVG